MTKSVCAIVGAGEGLGRSLAAKFASAGFDLALISRSESGSSSAMEAAKKARAESDIRFFAADAENPETIEQALEQVAVDLGNSEVLIYNVRDSFTACAPLDVTFEDLERNYRLEVVGAFAAARAVLPAMRSNGSGNILFSSATAALRGSASYSVYAIGKFGLRALSQSLAKAYARDGIHVVHFRLDCDLDMPLMREMYGDDYDPEKLANTDDVAESYWWACQQPRSAWSNEIELRPYTENWTY